MKKLKDLYQKNNAQLNDAFDRVVAEIHIRRQQRNLKTILLTGCEPQVGTTSMAINLAISSAKSGWSTLLVSADMRKAKKFQRLNEETEEGLAEYLTDSASLSSITYDTTCPNLNYIGAGSKVDSVVSMLCSAKMKEFLDTVSGQYDCIIIDMPSLSTAVDASVIGGIVDGVVLVTKQGEGNKKYIRDAKNTLVKANANVLGIIVNKVEQQEYKRAMKNVDYFGKQKYIQKKGK